MGFDKLLANIDGKPVLQHSVEAFLAVEGIEQIVVVCPEERWNQIGISNEDETQLRAIAIQAFNCLGAKGWGRVDVMRSSSGDWQVLEVNTVPGMTKTSLVPKAAKVFGLSFSQLVDRIAKLALAKA